MDVKQGSIIQPPEKETIQMFEKFYRVTLPDSFVNFINIYNGAVPQKLIVKSDNQDRLVERFLCLLDDSKSDIKKGQYDIGIVIAQIEDRLTNDEDLLGMNLIPFAAIFGGDFLCLDFRNDLDKPSVVLWDHNESDELEPVTYLVNESIDQFLENIM